MSSFSSRRPIAISPLSRSITMALIPFVPRSPPGDLEEVTGPVELSDLVEGCTDEDVAARQPALSTQHQHVLSRSLAKHFVELSRRLTIELCHTPCVID
jgi:hypothetical protein